MKRALLASAAAVVVTLLLLTWPDPPPDDQRDAAMPPPEPSPAQVRVEHRLITAEVVHERASAGLGATRPPVTPRVQRSAQREPEVSGLFARARRALLGDGRHRPEPFPRAKQE